MTRNEKKLAVINNFKVSQDGLNWFAVNKETGYIMSGIGDVMDAIKSLDKLATTLVG